MRKFVYIKYFWDLLHLYFANIKSVKRSFEINIKDIRNIEGIKIGRILEKRYLNKISWYLKLLYIFIKISFIFLLRFLFVLIIKL